jgi:predicted small lipoprotein YifL
MTSRTRRRSRVLLGALMTLLGAACGQSGPLELPESARPIERLPPAATPTPTPENQDDEQKNER